MNVTINQVEWSSWLSDVYQGRDYQSTVIGFDISSLSPATWYKRYYTDSSNDFTNFSDASYDEVYGKALATIDHDEKHQLYGELQQILTDQAASVFIEDPADLLQSATSIQVTRAIRFPQLTFHWSNRFSNLNHQ